MDSLVEVCKEKEWDDGLHLSSRGDADMDAEVKAMIKFLEEDADSFSRRVFSRRVEMFYEKHLELMKLVEEFYRSYRPLAERYDHARKELFQAYRTIAEAFPPHVPSVFHVETSLGSELHTPVTRHPVCSFFDPGDLCKDVYGLHPSDLCGLNRNGASSPEDSDSMVGRNGIKQLRGLFQVGEASSEDPKLTDMSSSQTVNQQGKQDRGLDLEENFPLSVNDKEHIKSPIHKEPKQKAKAEMYLHTAKEALRKIEAEKYFVLLQYEQSLEKLSDLEKQISHTQKDAREFHQQLRKSDIEVEELKEALAKLEAERDAILVQHTESLQWASTLEAMITAVPEDSTGLRERAVEAETESETLKKELSRSEAENEASYLLYKQFLEKISVLEAKMPPVEGHAKLLSERSNQVEGVVKALGEELFRLNEEKENAALRYKECLQLILKLENESRVVQQESRHINSEILFWSEKLKGDEDQCAFLESVNQSLQSEADSLAHRIGTKDQRPSEKHAELKKLQISSQDEHWRFVQAEATLQALQNFHSRSLEERRNLASELRNGLKMLNSQEICKHDLEVKTDLPKEENQSLGGLNLTTCMSVKDLRDELLRQIKERLENEVRRQEEQNQNHALQQHAAFLKEEIQDLRHRYLAIIHQLKSTGMEPESLSSSIRHMQDENTRLKEASSKEKAEKEVLLRKLEGMKDLSKKSVFLEGCLSDVNAELERVKSKAKMLKESCQFLNAEKSTLIGEKSALLSHLQIITESMQNLLEKNAMLERSLSGTNAELEVLRGKSKGLEELCQFLDTEKVNLLAERSNSISQLKNVEKKLENVETRFSRLEDNDGALHKEKEFTLTQVAQLRVSLGVEKQEQTCLVLTSETQLSALKDRIHHLKEENSCGRKEFEDQLEKTINAQVENVIMREFIQDMEDKNHSLFVECQKLVEATKYSDKLISEFEYENMMHQVEKELLLDRVEGMRTGIYQVFEALAIAQISETRDTGPKQNILPCIIAKIRDDRKSMLDSSNENLQLLIENSIFTIMLRELKLEGWELESQKKAVDRDFLLLAQRCVMLEAENCQILERSRRLDVEIIGREEREHMLMDELGILLSEKTEQQRGYAVLENEHVKARLENCGLRKEYEELQKDRRILEEENRTVLSEALAITSQCEIFKSYWMEKVSELCAVSENMDVLREAYCGLVHEAGVLDEKMQMKEVENLHLRHCAEQLEAEQCMLNEYNNQLKLQVLAGKELLDQKSVHLSEAVQELRLAQDKNAKFCCTVVGLEKKQRDLNILRENLETEVLALSLNKTSQYKEIRKLREQNDKLESEAGTLHEEIEEYKMMEAILSSVLHESSREIELWEDEAASFFFDLQISVIREGLYESKVLELNDLCECLKDVNSRGRMELQRTKQRVHTLEDEVEGLRAQLAQYKPSISSLKKNVSSLEQKSFLLSKHQLPGHPELQVALSTSDADYCSVQDMRDEICTETGVPELQKLQTRMKAIESVSEERMETVVQECMNASIKPEAAPEETEELQSRISSQQAKHVQQDGKLGELLDSGYELLDQIVETSEVRHVTQTKDIPLDHVSGGSSDRSSRKEIRRPDDQMLEIWDSAEHDSDHDLIHRKIGRHKYSSGDQDTAKHQFEIGERSETKAIPEPEIEMELGVDKTEVYNSHINFSQEGNEKEILERLTGNLEKLVSLNISVQELRNKMDTRKKEKSAKNFDYDKLRGRLQESEITVIQLMDTNMGLMRMVEDERAVKCDARTCTELHGSKSLHGNRVAEQAHKGSEKIGRLQLEMQEIHCLLLKLEDEKDNSERKSRFSESQTGSLMRESVYRREEGHKRERKVRFCGCIRSYSTTKN